MREDLRKRVDSRIAQMAGGDDVQDEMASLSIDEQLRLFGERSTRRTSARRAPWRRRI